ncbi:hypothetical protein PENSPDRAFT_758155 [Peniophora sp. CONT]|nr:hypothetical protein PENSPDRAFT_758155 [Peniophora sp. CONT]
MDPPILLGATLPDDIVYEVYRVLARIDPPRRPRLKGDRIALPGALGWIVLTHVCRRWRRIGTELSSLWAAIVNTFPPDDATILQRSKSQKLSMKVSSSRSYNVTRGTWPMMEALHILPRIRHLQFSLSEFTPDRGKAWSALVASPSLLHLTKLCIGSNHRSPFNSLPLEAPALRFLTTNVFFPLNAKNLKVLKVKGEHWHWRLLLHFLSHYPSLRELYCEAVAGEPIENFYFESEKIHRALEDGYAFARELVIPSPVVLARMETVEISDKHRELSGLLELLTHLDLPASISLHVDRIRGRERLLALLLRPEMRYSPRNTLTIRDMWGDDDEDFNVDCPRILITLTEGNVCLELGDADEDDSVQMSTWLELEYVPDVLEAMGRDVASIIRVLAFVHDCRCGEFGIECVGTIDCPNFSRVAVSLHRFKNVSELHLIRQGRCLLQILPSLCAPTSHTDWTFPALRILVLVLGDTQPRKFWDQLRAMLASRRAEGRPVERLVVGGTGACHARDFADDAEWSAGSECDEEEHIVALLKVREINLDEERQLVAEVVDEREMLCNCFEELFC